MYASRHTLANTVCCNHDLSSRKSQQTRHGSTIPTKLHCNATFCPDTNIAKILIEFGFQVVISFAELGTFGLHYLLSGT